jgi:Tol biopolymer transport system component
MILSGRANRTFGLVIVLLFPFVIPADGWAQGVEPEGESGKELPVKKVPGFYSAAEAYFSPDGQLLVVNALRTADEEDYHVYITNLDGTDIRCLEDKGYDACSFFFPDGKRLVFTSTRDNRHLPKGDYSILAEYPTGAELYTCNIDGSDLKRLTNNEWYEAEVSLSPDGEWMLFGRLIDGKMDLWRMRPDGSNEIQITKTPEWQEGGAFYLPDSEHILYRAWKVEDQGKRAKPMTVFTIKHDGSELRQITHDDGMNWAPHPSPNGKHFVFVKNIPPHNFEIFLMNMETGEQTRVTYNDAFDGFPVFSPDGHTINFSSSRDQEPGERRCDIYLMDISPLLK